MEESPLLGLYQRLYEDEQREVDGLVSRFPFGVTVNAGLVTGIIVIARPDLIELLWVRVDVFLHFAAAAVAITMSSLAIYSLAQSCRGREFEKIPSLLSIVRWRKEQIAKLLAAGEEEADARMRIDQATSDQLIECIAEAVEHNRTTSADRASWYFRSIQFMSFAVVALGVEALFALILWIGS